MLPGLTGRTKGDAKGLSKSKSTSGEGKHGIIITNLLLVIILALSMLYLAGCGTNSTQKNKDGASSQSGIQMTLPAGIEWSTGKSSGQLAGTKNFGQATTNVSASTIDRKIVQNADISLQVKDVPTAVDKILDLNKKNGGYTVNSHIHKNKNQISANLAVKVPQQKLNSFIASVAEFGEATDKTITTEDVTEEYYDSEARLKVLTAKEARLLSLMNKASNVTDIISIENELGQTRSEIEVLTGRLKYLSNATDYSLVNLNLEQAVPGALKAPQGTFGKAAQGLISSLNQLINFTSNFVVFLFVLLPWAIVLALLFLLVRYIYKKRKARIPNE
jgi:hypothetical protein